MKLFKKRRFKFGALVFLLAVFLYLLFFTDIAKFLNKEYVTSFVQSFGIYAPLSYMFIFAVATIFLVPATPLSLLAGVLFGILEGTLYACIGAAIGALISFTLARLLGRDWVEQKINQHFSGLKKYDQKLEEEGFFTVLFLRLVPIFPFAVLNYAIGLTRTKVRDFFFGTLLGIIPSTYVLVNIGAEADNPLSFKLYLFIAILALMMGIPYFYKNFIKLQNRLKERKERKKATKRGMT